MTKRMFRYSLLAALALLVCAHATPLTAGEIEWEEHTVDGDFDGARGVFAADVDGDGDMDVLGVAIDGDEVAWWENTTGDGVVWIKHMVDGDFDGARAVYAADLDGDGDMDALGAAEWGDDIAWWENTTGDGTVWTEHVLDGDFDGARSILTADVDGDGDLDVLGAGYADTNWWENINGDGTVWTEHTVGGQAVNVHAADVDGDGDLDVPRARWGNNEISWWENTTGDGTGWTLHLVDVEFDLVNTVYASDVDGDGDMDLLGATSGDPTTWWENTTGDGTVWAKHTLDDGFPSFNVYAADIDEDGDLDILAAATSDEVTWWENTEGDGTVWTNHTIDADSVSPRWVLAADVDGDGDLDVLGAASGADDITWWENLSPAVGGSVSGVRPSVVTCQNLTTGASITRETSLWRWDCERLGLEVEDGDEVLIGAIGEVSDCVERYLDNRDGTVTDCENELVWLKDATCGWNTWDDAMATVTALADGECGLADGSVAGQWRLPTQSEWERMVASAVEQGFVNPALTNTAGDGKWSEGDPFQRVRPGSYWSSTELEGQTDFAWVLRIWDGSTDIDQKTISNFIWPVKEAE